MESTLVFSIYFTLAELPPQSSGKCQRKGILTLEIFDTKSISKVLQFIYVCGRTNLMVNRAHFISFIIFPFFSFNPEKKSGSNCPKGNKKTLKTPNLFHPAVKVDLFYMDKIFCSDKTLVIRK